MTAIESTQTSPPSKPAAFSRRITSKISVRNLAGLLRRTGLSYRAGVDLLKIWEQEAARGRPIHRQHMETIHRSIRNHQFLQVELLRPHQILQSR